MRSCFFLSSIVSSDLRSSIVLGVRFGALLVEEDGATDPERHREDAKEPEAIEEDVVDLEEVDVAPVGKVRVSSRFLIKMEMVSLQ